MILAIDIGNTNITLGLFQGDKLINQYRLSSDLKLDHESYAIDIIELIVNDNIDCMDVSGVIISSVVPDLTKIIDSALRKFYPGQIIILDKDQIDIEIDLKDKNEVGVDRLVNAKAAHKKYGGDLIIIDFGTATTFDIVGSKGQYLGGVIAPGVNLSIKALHDMTAKLPNITVKYQKNVIGKSTREAMNSGIYFGYISLIEGLISKIKEEYGSEMKVITTGGLSALFNNDAIKNINHIEPDLTLQGLMIIAK